MATEYDLFETDEQTTASVELKRLYREQEVSDFKWLMAHKQGRRVMWRLLGMTGLFRNPYIAGDDSGTHFRCGEQNVGQQLMAEIHGLCPEHYHTMTKEYQEYVRRHERNRNDRDR
jgi:hypothetical protein